MLYTKVVKFHQMHQTVILFDEVGDFLSQTFIGYFLFQILY